MPTFSFSMRLLIDYDFYQNLIKNSNQRLMIKLMYINARSADYKRSHNRMCAKSFFKILGSDKREESSESLLKASFYPIDEPKSIYDIEDEIERNIQFAIELSAKKPFKTAILTTDNKKEQYQNNSHFNGITNVTIKSGQDAILLIDEFYRETID